MITFPWDTVYKSFHWTRPQFIRESGRLLEHVARQQTNNTPTKMEIPSGQGQGRTVTEGGGPNSVTGTELYMYCLLAQRTMVLISWTDKDIPQITDDKVSIMNSLIIKSQL